VNVQVQRRTEALDQRHRAGVAYGAGEPRLLKQIARDRAVDGAQYQRQRIRIRRQQKPQGNGERQHPLSQRAFWQHFISEQCSGLGHATRATGGTKPALLAAERHPLIGVATAAAHAQESFLQPAALQIGIELLRHVVGKGSTFPCSQLTEIRIVPLDQPIQQRGLGAMLRVARGLDEGRRAWPLRTGGGGHEARAET